MPHAIQFNNPLGAETLRFHTLLLHESLSQVSEGRLTVLSKKRDLDIDALLGQKVSLEIETQHWGKRYHSAYVTRFEVGARHEQDYQYHIELRPWLWFLSRTADCKIFQNMTVPDIVQQVLADCPVSVVASRLTKSYQARPYVVQYRESDLNFVCRLLEREGIYFFFEHSADNHTLVLADSIAAHKKLEGGYATLPYSDGANALGMSVDKESLSVWRSGKSIQSGQYVLNDYDFTRPRADMKVVAMKPRPHPFGDQELYDYPGEYKENFGIGDAYVRTRLDEWQSQHQRMFAAGGVRGCFAGGLFALEKHPRADQNQDYLIISATTRLEEAGYEASGGQFHASVELEVQPSANPYAPPRQTPKPFVQGPQTALVVGPAGEEIWTDEHGRVKVQFYWDRYGKKDDHSSCWVRVSHPWAGAGFGGIHIPRIGQEVVVSFLEGDPDYPMITGRVYNGENTVPWALPANKTQSGFLTRSSLGGGAANANAFRFEDKKGEEEVWLHAEKDQRIEVEHDESHWVGNDRTKTIDHDETTHVKHDRTETVDNNETITIHGHRTETVDKNETITIHQNRTEVVDQNETITIHQNRTERVDKSEIVDVGDNRTMTVGKDEKLEVGKNKKDKIGKNWSMKVGMFKTETIGLAYMQNVGLAKMVSIGAAYIVNVGAEMKVSVGDSRSDTISSDHTHSVGSNFTSDVSTNHSTTVGDTYTVSAGGASSQTMDASSIVLAIGDSTVTLEADKIAHETTKQEITASSEIILRCGASTIKMTPGQIEILSPLVKINDK